jgi:hypothetical protein
MPVAARGVIAAAAFALAGASFVLLAYAWAGGGDRALPSYTFDDCVLDADGNPAGGVPGFEPCREVVPNLTAEYRSAWAGLAISLAGAGLLLIVLARRPISRDWAYGALSCVAAVFVIVSLSIILGSVEVDVIGGSAPRPDDAFESTAKRLFLAGLALVPAGAVVRRFAPRAPARPAGTPKAAD